MGDFAPTRPLTKWIAIFHVLNGVILLLLMFDVVRTQQHWDLGSSLEEDILLDENPTLSLE
jgi:hypothetical protein